MMECIGRNMVMKKCCGVHALRILVGITMLALLLVVNAGAITIRVNASGAGDYSRIQDAINNASSGDTILVYSGIYHENVNVNKQLNLRGIGNPMVDARGSGSAITLAADGITLEGFTATGSGGGNYYDAREAGIKVTSSNNTLRGNNASNNGLYNYDAGIFMDESSNNTLTGNNASNNSYDGISLSYSSNNTLSSNNVSNKSRGIVLEYSSNNTLTGNNAGIVLSVSNNNILTGNNASNNGYGISLEDSSNNTLSGNKASNNLNSGIWLYSSSNNMLSNNQASNNVAGIWLYSSGNNTLLNNVMTGNRYNFMLDGGKAYDFQNQIGKSNLVNGKPIYYIKGAKNTIYDSSTNAGTFYCINCLNVIIKDLRLNENGHGVFFWNTTFSKIQNVKVYNNYNGISLFSSSNNKLNGNNVLKNYRNGIRLWSSSNNTLNSNNVSNNGKNRFGGGGIVLWSSSNNNIYNNLFKNRNNIEISNSKNRWNISQIKSKNIISGSYIGGNFWAHPKGKGFSQTCKDMNGDGICDQSYILDAKNIDYLPLAKDKIPPKSVSNLKNITYAKNYINWTWKDPKDIDFRKVMVYIDSKFKKNVSKGKRYYNATNFTANTMHTISTWTVDMNGNINKTWTNRSAWTAK